MKEGKVDKYLDKPAGQPRRNADNDNELPTKMIRINGIFTESEQSILSLDPSLASPEQDAEDIDFPHDDALVVICPTSPCHSRQNDGRQWKCSQPTSTLSHSEDGPGKHNHTPSRGTHRIQRAHLDCHRSHHT